MDEWQRVQAILDGNREARKARPPIGDGTAVGSGILRCLRERNATPRFERREASGEDLR